MTDLTPLLLELRERLDRIEHQLEMNVEKESYTVEDAADRLDRRPWTVRQWCNKGQVKGAYKVQGKEWRIPHAELIRLQNEGPLPERVCRAA